MTKTKVLIVDDSALVRQMLKAMLESDDGLTVVGQASNPLIAREMIKQTNPDVLTLDVEMPGMDGLTFLEKLMRLRPMPVVMISSLTEQGAQTTFDALALGAVDFVTKPKLDLAAGLEEASREIIQKVKAAARCRPRLRTAQAPGAGPGGVMMAGRFKTTDRIIAIGASTGGTEAIREVLMQFPADAPGTVIAQHIPPGFSKTFAERLDRSCSVRVLEAGEGQRVLPGHVLIAPGGRHLKVERNGAHWVCRLDDGPTVNQYRPSVDVLFESVAVSARANAAGLILTGMGHDGAKGLKVMREAGAWTAAQDEATSVVWGMPGSAVKLGAAAVVLPLNRMAGSVLEALRG